MGCPSYDLLQGSGELQVAEKEREKASCLLQQAGKLGGAAHCKLCERQKKFYNLSVYHLHAFH